MKSTLFFILLLLPFAYNCSIAQEGNRFTELITEETSKKHLSILASEEFAGRGTGQEGGLKAANYIAEQFKSYGLKPVINDTSFFQDVKLLKSGYDVEPLQIGNTTYIYGKDFLVQGQNKFEKFESKEIIFIGYGIQDKSYDELKDLNIKNKVVLVIDEAEPIDPQGQSLITKSSSKSTWTTNRYKRIQNLLKHEPKAILSTSSKVKDLIHAQESQRSSNSFRIEEGPTIEITGSNKAPVIRITEDVANKILASLNTSLITYKVQAAQMKQQLGQVIPLTFSGEMGYRTESIVVPNVLGLLEGTDKKDEIVVVCAHYDHDGILPNGTYFPGADDNGSGTVGILELARAFSAAHKEGMGPRRSILFIGLAAEERGLLGSKYYVEHPVFPLDQTVACVNIDMIGRIDNKHLNGDHNYIHVIGVSKLSTDLKPIVELANQHIQTKLDYEYDHPEEPMKLYYRSDHYNFAKNGIPSLFFFSGLHPHYHTPEDTVDKINFPMMVKREKLIFHTVWELANRNNPPLVNLPLEDARGSGR